PERGVAPPASPPATRPDMRVRIRRFERLRLAKPAFPSAPCPESPIAPHHCASPRGFTPAPRCEFRRRGRLTLCPLETDSRSALPSVRPFAHRLSRPCPLRLATT